MLRRSMSFLLVFCFLIQFNSKVTEVFGSPVTNFGGDRQNPINTFVFQLPKTRDSTNLLSRVSSLSASGRSYGSQPPISSAQARVLNPRPPTADKDAIVYPDDVSRDSYGNIVTPYVPLPDTSGPTGNDGTNVEQRHSQVTGVGFMTDVNRDTTHLVNNGGKPGVIQFVLPSYADGILSTTNDIKRPNLDLQPPPLSSGNYNYPLLTTLTKAPSSIGSNVDITYQNEVNPSYPIKTGPPAPDSSLLPPKISLSGPGSSYGNQPKVPQQIPVQIQNPSYQNDGFNQHKPLQIPVSIQTEPDYSNRGSTQQSSPPSTSYNQKPIGPPLNTQPLQIPVQVQPPPFSSSAAASASASANRNRPDQSYQIPVIIQSDPLPNGGKYTGGFGGAPGVLGEQKTPGYAVPSPSDKADASHDSVIHGKLSDSSLATFSGGAVSNNQHGPTLSGSSGSSYSGGAVSNNQHAPTLSGSSGSSYSGAAASASASATASASAVAVATVSSPAIAPPHHDSTLTNNGGKYTGGFGGPPGILTPYDNTIPNGSTTSSSNYGGTIRSSKH